MVHCIYFSASLFFLQIFHERNPVDGYMYDFQDGQLFHQHPLFKDDNNALQLIAYYDDVETSNPLGSYRIKHKLGKLVDTICVY